MKKRFVISLLLILSLILTLGSCKKGRAVEYCELGIVLPKDFEPYDSNGAFDVAYSSSEAIVGIVRYSFVDCHEYGFLSTLTPEVFAEVYLEKYGDPSSSSVGIRGDVPYYTYTKSASDGNSYFYMPTFYRTPYAYFVITFISPSAISNEMEENFLEYAETAYILDEHF
jgi:hypothetical protein